MTETIEGTLMTQYRCSQCDREYNSTEYRALDTRSLKTDDPEDQYGVEAVCECGAGFHTDKWHQRTTVATDDGEIDVSTVALNIAHGLDRDEWFETCLFHENGSNVVRRYETQDEAEDGHESIVGQLERGEYSVEASSAIIDLGA